MDQNDKIADGKIAKMENEIKVLKNEVQAVLLDLRESYLNMENPFNSTANPTSIQPIVISQQAPARESKSETQPEALPKIKPTEPEKDSAKASKEEENSPVARLARPEPKTIREEMKMTPNWHSELESRPTPSQEPALRKNAKLDLITVAGLTGWVEDATRKLGRERTEAILDISETMGYVYSELKPILVKLIALAPPRPVENTTIRMRDYMDALIKLNSLLGNDNREESALLLLSIMNGDKNNG